MFCTQKIKPSLLLLMLAGFFNSCRLQAEVLDLYKPVQALGANDLAVIVNDEDPLSRLIGVYYQQKRHIPAEQVIHIRFSPHRDILLKSEFEELKRLVDKKTPEHVQAFVLTWLQPFRVECMSITTAFAAGFNRDFCAEGCKHTRHSPYYASETGKPFKSFGWRPTMVLAGKNFNEVKNLIDKGEAADYSHPQGSAYLLKTSDRERSSRALFFPEIAEKFKNFWPVNYLEQDFIAGRKDVMFYFTGLTLVPRIDENTYPPGAIADHLTSYGGVLSRNDQMNIKDMMFYYTGLTQTPYRNENTYAPDTIIDHFNSSGGVLPGSGQMSILEWLKAGATASYGTVVEPCNFPAKFSNPGVLLYFYLRGSSLIEAYWKSVAEPGQGIFVGEPLAKPFAYPRHKRPD